MIASIVPALAHQNASDRGPLSIEVIGPEQTGFTPRAVTAPVVITPSTAAALQAAAARSVRSSAAASTGKSAAPPPQPKRVTGLSLFLDAMQTGGNIGLPELYGLAVSGFTTIVPTDQLPKPIVDEGFTVLAVPPKIFDSMKAPSAQGYAALRQAIAPLAAGNAGANALLTLLSNTFIKLGTDDKSLVNPFDAQVVELGKFLLVLEEPA
jgi:hypothetical protein